MSGGRDVLAAILERKRVEVRRRYAHASLAGHASDSTPLDSPRGGSALAALRRGSADPMRVIAELKFRSPSAGVIRPRAVGEAVRVARSYVRSGAAAVSVLADAPAFGGSPLEVRRVARSVDTPVLFKEFVLDEIQVRLARAAGASLVLLLVCALDDATLHRLIDAVRVEGMEPVVEAADDEELERALATDATIVGINARDLRSFDVDQRAAARRIEAIPGDRVAVLMSGIGDSAQLARAGRGRADAALIGEGLMRAPDPGVRLRELLVGHP